MARSDRTVLEPLSTYDLSTNSDAGTSVRSLAVCSVSDSQTIIYIGTHSGSLLSLSANPNPKSDDDDGGGVTNAASKRSVSLLSSVSVGDSPIETVIVLGGSEKVVVLCDGSLFLVDWLLAQPVKRLGVFKGVSVISRRITTSESECSGLSVVSSGGSESSSASQRLFRKLGAGIKVNGTKTKEPEPPESQGNAYLFAVVCGKRLILTELRFGHSRLGKIDRDIDAVNGSLVLLKEMQCIDGVKTMVWLNDSIILGTAHGYSLFSSVTGQSGVIFTLPDESSLPLLKLLGKEKAVLLLVDNVGIVVGDHGQPIGGSFVFHSRPDSVAELSSHVVLVRDGRVELYHKKSGSCIQTVVFGPEGVGPSIVASGENGNGKIIAVATSTKVIFFRNVPAEEQIKDLLRKRNFKEAISLVEELECEGEISKEMLSFVHAQVGFLLLFALHFEEAVDHFLRSETMQPSEIFPFIMRDPNRWSLLFPRNRYWGLHPPPAPLEDIVDDGLITIQRAIFLRKAGVDTEVDEDFLLNQPTRADLIQLAIKNMIRYLEVSRQKELTLLVREGVDTLLMYLYRALNRVHDMEKLASSENCCIVEELETLLDDSGHLRTLAFLYASKGMNSKALAIWRILARNYSSGLWKDTPGQGNSHDSSANVVSSREFAATEACKILEESADQKLVLQHLGWIAEVNPVLAVQVLTSEKRTNQLSPDEVIITIDSKKVEILQRYLQWLIEDQGCNDTRFHTLYALSLAKSAIETFEEENTSQDLDNRRPEARCDDFGRNSIFQSPVRERLQFFLLSDLYDVEEVLDLIEGSELWLEKAILYRKLGQETLVLQILALKLEDSEAAEQYCAEIGRPEAYMQLLDMYLDPQNGREPMFKAAVRLLHNHGESLDPLQVLETLSLDMPLQLASDTILRMLRARFHHYRQGQIVHNLSRAVDIDTRLARLEERSRHVQINDESLCDSCHTRLGTKLFAMYPDDTVVCYKCFRRQGESTSVMGRDFKQDILFKPGWLVTR